MMHLVRLMHLRGQQQQSPQDNTLEYRAQKTKSWVIGMEQHPRSCLCTGTAAATMALFAYRTSLNPEESLKV